MRIKDAICDRFRADTGKRPNVDTREPDDATIRSDAAQPLKQARQNTQRPRLRQLVHDDNSQRLLDRLLENPRPPGLRLIRKPRLRGTVLPKDPDMIHAHLGERRDHDADRESLDSLA